MADTSHSSVLGDLDERDQKVLDVLEKRKDAVGSVELASAALVPVGEVSESIAHLADKGLVKTWTPEELDETGVQMVELRRDALAAALS